MNQLIENFDQEYNCVYLEADLRQSCLKGTKYQHVIEGQELGHVITVLKFTKIVNSASRELMN